MGSVPLDRDPNDVALPFINRGIARFDHSSRYFTIEEERGSLAISRLQEPHTRFNFWPRHNLLLLNLHNSINHHSVSFLVLVVLPLSFILFFILLVFRKYIVSFKHSLRHAFFPTRSFRHYLLSLFYNPRGNPLFQIASSTQNKWHICRSIVRITMGCPGNHRRTNRIIGT